jgi:hypothetical protein
VMTDVTNNHINMTNSRQPLSFLRSVETKEFVGNRTERMVGKMSTSRVIARKLITADKGSIPGELLTFQPRGNLIYTARFEVLK